MGTKQNKENVKCWNFPAKRNSISGPASLTRVQRAPLHAVKALSLARRKKQSLAMPLEEHRAFFPGHFPYLWQCILHCGEIIEFRW